MVASDRRLDEILGRRFYGWSDEFNLFRINHKPRPIFAGAVEIGKDHREI